MLSLIDSKTPHTLELSSLLPWLFHPRFFYDSFSLSWLLNVGMRPFPVLGPFIFRWWSHNSLMTWNTIYILINSKYMTASKHHSSTLNSCNSQLPTQCLHLVCNIDLDWCDYMWIFYFPHPPPLSYSLPVSLLTQTENNEVLLDSSLCLSWPADHQWLCIWKLSLLS